MSNQLEDYLKGRKYQGFKPIPCYFQDGNFITCFSKDDMAYEEVLSPYLSIYHCMQTDEIVGCKVHLIKETIEDIRHNDS